MFFFRSIIILIVLGVFSPLSYAQEIHVATDIWEGYSNGDGTGYYFDILREIYPSPEYVLKVSYVPFRRGLRMVETARADVTLGVNRGDMDDGFIAKPVVENDTVDLLMSRDLAQKWQGLNSLKNKRIAARSGYNFDIHFDFPIEYSENNSLLGMMRMLKIGRIDAVLDYLADMKNLWEQACLDDNYIIMEAVLASPAFFAFSREQQDLKKHFETKFQELLQSGRVYELGRKYGIEESQLP